MMFNWDATTLLEIAARTTIVYVFLLVALRLSGRRELGQLTLFDLVLVLVLSNAVQNAMTGPDTSVTGGIVAALTLLLLDVLISLARSRDPRLETLLEGSPTLLVHNGQFIPEHLRRERISEAEVEQALREHGVGDLSECQAAVLEVDGSISVITNGKQSRTPAIASRRRRRFLQRHI
jgi:uncharacterized membrane protein YcaP (DUF421 family)